MNKNTSRGKTLLNEYNLYAFKTKYYVTKKNAAEEKKSNSFFFVLRIKRTHIIPYSGIKKSTEPLDLFLIILITPAPPKKRTIKSK